jgi:MFS family permease
MGQRDLQISSTEFLPDSSTSNDNAQLWMMATLAFAIFYNNYMVAPLIPAISHESSVPANQLSWLIAGYLIPYGISNLVFGALSDWWGRGATLVVLLCFAAAST